MGCHSLVQGAGRPVGPSAGRILPERNVGPNLIVIDRVFREDSPAKHYYDLGKEYAGHDTVNHRYEEYVRYTKDPEYVITTNTVEGYYSIFKRGMKGVYQHCKEKHLHRYLAEFDFRYSNRVAATVPQPSRMTKSRRRIPDTRASPPLGPPHPQPTTNPVAGPWGGPELF